jgi:hypothetical protein
VVSSAGTWPRSACGSHHLPRERGDRPAAPPPRTGRSRRPAYAGFGDIQGRHGQQALSRPWADPARLG